MARRAFRSVSFLILIVLAASVLPASAGADRSDGSPGVSTRDAVAVVIGNRRYGHGLPEVRYAGNDARAAAAFLRDVLGYRDGNVIEMIDASQAQMLAMFGNAEDHRGKLWSWIKPGRSDVFVFYSGHGLPGVRDRRGYLLPVDADPATPEINGYPLDLLVSNLAKLETRSTVVLVDACFSGDSAGGRLIDSASPVYVAADPPAARDEVVLITAARGNQLASWDHDARYGLFTLHVLEALGGRADRTFTGDGDGRVTVGEVRAYLDEEMTYAARRSFRRVQQASVSGRADTVLVPALPDSTWSLPVPPVEDPDAEPAAPPAAAAKRSDTAAAALSIGGEYAVPGDAPGAVEAFLVRHAGEVRRAIVAYDRASASGRSEPPIADLAWLRVLQAREEDFDVFVQFRRGVQAGTPVPALVSYATFRVQVTADAVSVVEMWR